MVVKVKPLDAMELVVVYKELESCCVVVGVGRFDADNQGQWFSGIRLQTKQSS